MNTDCSSNLYDILKQIQLEKYLPLFKDKLQITQLHHFNYVKVKDLENIGMSRPAISRLLDAVDRANKKCTQPLNLHVRPAPLPPTHKHILQDLSSSSSLSFSSNISQETYQSGRSKLYNNNLNKTLLTNKIMNRLKNSSNTETIQKNNEQSRNQVINNANNSTNQPYSVIINQNDIKILKNNRDEDEVLGTGHFGVVKKALWRMPNGLRTAVAVKCLHENIEDSNFNAYQAQLDIINEVSCMSSLEHENLIKLFGIVLNQKSSTFIMLVTEIAPFGSLLNHLRKKRDHGELLSIEQLSSYILQISSGMEFLESNQLIHRDLACRNILLYNLQQIKICDFGMTRSIKKEGLYKMKETHKIPCAWYPPESIREKIFTHKSDVWMFAVTCWEIFTLGEHPWPNMSALEILNEIETESKRLPIPNLCTKGIYSIFNKCWSKNPNERPSFQLLKKLLRGIKFDEMRAKEDYKNDNKLEFERGDIITIIEGNAAKYWWKGQNKRTLRIGYFPRSSLDPIRKLSSEDISLPLKNSFIHTGHMSSGSGDRTWGNPQTIDPIFLSNPLNPPDLLIDPTLVESEHDIFNDYSVNKVEIIDKVPINDVNYNDSANLLDLSFPEVNNAIYPEYSTSTDSFSSTKSPSPSSQTSSQRNFNILSNQSNFSSAPSYISNNPSNFDLDFMKLESKEVRTSSTNYYNDIDTFLPKIELNGLSTSFTYKTDDYRFDLNYSSNTNTTCSDNSSNNPFFDYLTTTEVKKDHNIVMKNLSNTKNKNFNFTKCKNQTIDEFLNKVMNDVIDDFKKSKNTFNNVKTFT